MQSYLFKLERQAKSSGGDRYECTDVMTNGKPWMIYFPQEVSRENGTPKDTIEVILK
jgi:hypothetical protein